MSNNRRLLEDLAAGKITVDEAERRIRGLNLDRVGDLALLDIDRDSRGGVPEVVMAETKTAADVTDIVTRLLEIKGFAVVSRLDSEKLYALRSALGDDQVEVYGREPAITAIVHTPQWKPPSSSGKIALITAGTSDIPYADEARVIAEVLGVDVLVFTDVGVAGIHRLIEPMKKIVEADVDAIVVFAGMEGALPTVVAALVDIPVIGVPVPVGYGFGGKGETALASMLQSCSPGLAVVNIGNGIGAGAVASLIALRANRKKP
ncbi:MAG: nickel pincer cofactor biosynthesis protein LarB [Candidatus Thorarchaeota archaeon]